MTETIKETPLVLYTLGGWNVHAVGSSIGRSIIDGELRQKKKNKTGNGVGHLLFFQLRASCNVPSGRSKK